MQELRRNKRRNTKTNKQGLFSGLIFCADCGSKLNFATCKRFVSTQDHYRCLKYKGNTGSCTVHFIREKTMKKIVLNQIFQVTAMMYDNADEFFSLVARQQIDFHQFRQIVRKYVGITELTPTIVIEFVNQIIVHALDKSSGHRVQKIQIVVNFIGEFVPQDEFIPDKKEIPQDYL